MKADIKIGFLCNNHCKFCVQGDKRDTFGNKHKGIIEKELVDARRSCSDIVFTGGEPTLHKNFFDLISFAKKLGFKTIQIQTNGRLFAYNEFCQEAIRKGANEFSPALHGHVPELHDFLTNSPGSFNQTVKGIINLKKLGQKVITNTVITKSNFRHLPGIARKLIKLGVDQFQLAFPHPLGRAKENFSSIVPRVAMIEPYVKRALDIGIDSGKKVMTEAIPYCFMQGYENFIVENFLPSLKIYDANFIIEDFTKVRKTEGKLKSLKCIGCKYYRACEGPWREYPDYFGWDEFIPVKSALQKHK